LRFGRFGQTLKLSLLSVGASPKSYELFDITGNSIVKGEGKFNFTGITTNFVTLLLKFGPNVGPFLTNFNYKAESK
jgi:hypothetical protein